MIDWCSSMQQTYEFYVVDPNTWKDKARLESITSCVIDRDSSALTLGSATIESTETIGECYIRVYLIAIQNGVSERIPLGTYLVQSPSVEFDGKSKSITLDAYTPLLELKENPPPIGYAILEGTKIMSIAATLCFENMRAPVVNPSDDKTIDVDFVASLNDNWLTYLKDLILNAKYEFALDELGRVMFAPIQDIASLQPVWTYNDDNSSILYPDISIERDLYGIPNVVEVVYSKNVGYYYSKVVNDDENSPISTVSRGREVVYRITDPELGGDPTQEYIDAYAEQTLRNMSRLEFTITYTHGYCPVRIGDCVYLNYPRSGLGLENIKAKVINQSIRCVPGCPVEETAICTMDLWG